MRAGGVLGWWIRRRRGGDQQVRELRVAGSKEAKERTKQPDAVWQLRPIPVRKQRQAGQGVMGGKDMNA